MMLQGAAIVAVVYSAPLLLASKGDHPLVLTLLLSLLMVLVDLEMR